MDSPGECEARQMKLGIKLRTLLIRAPKNVRSNRLWVFWGGKLYLRSPSAHLQIPPSTPPEIRDWVIGAKKYVLFSQRLKSSPFSLESSAVVLTELGMFGNMCRRLANGLSLVSALGSSSIAVPSDVIFHEGIFRSGSHEIGQNQRLWFGAAPTSRSNKIVSLLVGDMFHSHEFDKPSTVQHVNLAWETLNNLLLGTSKSEPFDSRTLAVHLRGGDVFGPRKPQAYGQPPLAFYEFVLRHSNWKSVVIVHQDHSNPVLPEIQELCRKLNLKFELQSGSVVEDIAALLKAETVVAGRGTFIPAVANLSRHCRRVFYFEDKCNLVPRRTGIELIRVSDQEKTYKEAILSNNWQNTPEQRELMMSYPLSSLVIESSGPTSPG